MQRYQNSKRWIKEGMAIPSEEQKALIFAWAVQFRSSTCYEDMRSQRAHVPRLRLLTSIILAVGLKTSVFLSKIASSYRVFFGGDFINMAVLYRRMREY